MQNELERPQWAAEHVRVLEHEQGGVTYKVPPSVKERIAASAVRLGGEATVVHACISSLLPVIPDSRSYSRSYYR